eukprot:SAG31_NODE_23029_length_513_cov_0.659420_1_plen_135_part_10
MNGDTDASLATSITSAGASARPPRNDSSNLSPAASGGPTTELGSLPKSLPPLQLPPLTLPGKRVENRRVVMREFMQHAVSHIENRIIDRLTALEPQRIVEEEVSEESIASHKAVEEAEIAAEVASSQEADDHNDH